MKVAALYTCFNRKEKTLSSLASLFRAYKNSSDKIFLSVYLTDDNSSDGTSEAVARKFPDVKILKGNGELYWAGGMRNSWGSAVKKDYDAYLLLNDDTDVKPELFDRVLRTDKICRDRFGKEGIYVGNTSEPDSNEISYGGWVFTNRFLAKMERVPLDNLKPLKCEAGNANIMWVPRKVVAQIGILSEGYNHGMADFDYSLKALRAKIPVLVMPGIMGVCNNDHSNPYKKFMNLPFQNRIKMLYHPVGLDFNSQLHYMRKHFPLRLPIVFIMGWFKVLFPKYYYEKFLKSRIG